jgi:lycopene cyclase domain-containing protein
MSLYLYINIAIILFPLLFTFEKRIKYYTKIKNLIGSILIIGSLFIAWDVFATFRGHWSFNPNYVLETKFLGLPIEEILFFITVPFSCIFAYEGIKYYLKDSKLFSINKWIPKTIGILFIVLALVSIGGEYTTLALASVGITIIFVSNFMKELFSSKLFWIYIAFTILVFLIFNYLLTSIPIVEYSSFAIIGFRVVTIPIEDFMFNFSMLTLYLTVYLWFSKRRYLKLS